MAFDGKSALVKTRPPMMPANVPGLTPNAEPSIAVVAAHSGGHVPELDGIRALAIWGVLVVHLLFAIPVSDAGRMFIPRVLVGPLGHMWLGVDLFFVLSGFLITGILLKAKGLSRSEFFRRFYKRRALRIWPLYFVVLAALFLAYGTHFATYFMLCVLFVANFTWGGIVVPDGAGPFWSLAVEEQFYLIWPWLVLCLSRRRLMTVAAAIVAIELIARLFARPDQLPLTWFRADGLAMGAFVGAWFANWNNDRQGARNLALSLVAIAVAIAAVTTAAGHFIKGISSSTTISQAVCIFGALVIVAVAYSGHPLLSFLRSRVASVTAMLSYSIYLLHRPLIDAFTALFGDAPWFTALTPSAQTLLRAAIVVALCYAGATATRYLIELPFLRLGQRRNISTNQ